MKALNEGNIRDLIPAMAGAVQTANNAASLGGIATPNTDPCCQFRTVKLGRF